MTKQIVNHQSSIIIPSQSKFSLRHREISQSPIHERINISKQPLVNTIAPGNVSDDIPKALRTIARVLLATVHSTMSTVLRQRAAVRARRRTLHLACNLGSQVLAKCKVTALLYVLEHVLGAYGESLVRVYMLVG